MLDPIVEELIEDLVFEPVKTVFDLYAEPVGETELELLELLFALDEEAVWDADADAETELFEDNFELVRDEDDNVLDWDEKVELKPDDCVPDACKLDDANFEVGEADAEVELELADEVGFELSVSSIDGEGLLLAGACVVAGGLSEEAGGSSVLGWAVIGVLLVGASSLAFGGTDAGWLDFGGFGSLSGGGSGLLLSPLFTGAGQFFWHASGGTSLSGTEVKGLKMESMSFVY